jgi:uncharacterized protein
MAVLPARPDLEQLRRQARELLRAAERGDPGALARIQAVSARVMPASAQLAVARSFGFAGWVHLVTEVTRRQVLDDRDVVQLAAMVAADPALATASLQGWADHPLGATPLAYVAMLRFDTSRQIWGDVTGTGELTRALLSAGAPVDGHPDDRETPLITAASYGDAAVARVLLDAGADLERRATPTAGGVPGGTALLHAAVFGMTAVVDVLVAAGAHVPDLVLAAAADDVSRWPLAAASPTDRVLALVMAADHERLDVIDQLVAAGTPVDDPDPVWGRHPLRLAAHDGRAAAARRLLALGADPQLTDHQGRTPLQLARAGQAGHPTNPGYHEVLALLQ